jgi:hypothetical protein
MYTTFDGGNTLLPLPYRSSAGGTFNTIGYALSAGTITIRRSTDGCKEAACRTQMSSILQYRYVITPGSTPAS